MDRGCDQADKVVLGSDKLKKLLVEMTKTVNTMQEDATETKNTMLQVRELDGMETPNMGEERLRIFAITLSEVRSELNALELKSAGKSSRLRHRLLAHARNTSAPNDKVGTPDIDTTEGDTSEETVADATSMRNARRQLATIEAHRRAKAKTPLTGQQKDEQYLRDRLDPPTLAAIQQKYVGVEADMSILPLGTFMFMQYGQSDLAPYSPGAGATPGELRLCRLEEYFPGDMEDTYAKARILRIELGGNVLKWKRVHTYYELYWSKVSIVNEKQVAAYKKDITTLVNAQHLNSIMADMSEAASERSGGGSGRSGGGSGRSGGGSGSGGSGGGSGSGIRELTDSHGRREGQLIAQAQEASLLPSDGYEVEEVAEEVADSAGTAADSVEEVAEEVADAEEAAPAPESPEVAPAPPSTVINEATGRRLYGTAAKHYLAKRQRQG